MKVISVVNQKGGCGKTITAVNLSAALSKGRHKVLLIDLDPQAHATFSLKKENSFTLTDMLEKVCKKETIAGEITTPISDNFHFIPSSIGLTSLEHKLSSHDNKLDILSIFLKDLKDKFDYCIIDCPPSLGILTLNALVASRYSIIPLSICDFSLKGTEILKNIFSMLKEFKGITPLPFYLLNQFDQRSNFARQFIDRAKNKLGNLLLNTVIRTNIHLREAAGAGKDIFAYNPNCRGAKDFINLGEEVKKVTDKTVWMQLLLKGEKFSHVYVVGDFNQWQREEKYKLKKVARDIWSINLPLEKGKYIYKFVAGDTWFADPHNKLAEDDAFGGKNSVLYVE